MLTREPFIALQEDDTVLSNIIQNHYGITQQSIGIPASPLHTLLPFAISLDSPAATDIFHTLLPQEIHTSCLSEISNVESVTQIEVVIGRNLNVNSQLATDQILSLIKFLKVQQQAFAWDYHDMKGLNPTLCTHRIYIKEDCKPIR